MTFCALSITAWMPHTPLVAKLAVSSSRGHPEFVEDAKIGIPLGCLVSAAIACLMLRLAPKAHGQDGGVKAPCAGRGQLAPFPTIAVNN